MNCGVHTHRWEVQGRGIAVAFVWSTAGAVGQVAQFNLTSKTCVC